MKMRNYVQPEFEVRLATINIPEAKNTYEVHLKCFNGADTCFPSLDMRSEVYKLLHSRRHSGSTFVLFG